MSQSDQPIPEAWREAAREEARQVYQDLAAEDSEGRTWTVGAIVEQFGMTRRQAMIALSLIAVGASPLVALTRAAGETWGSATGEEGTDASPLQDANIQDLDVQDLEVTRNVLNSLIPDSASSYDLGSSSNPWQALYVDSLVIGGTLYEEDGNSPINVSGVSSTTYTLATASPQIVILPDQTTTGFDQLRVGGDTAGNYSYVDNSDTQSTGQNEWSVPRGETTPWYILSDQGGSTILSAAHGNGTGRTVGGRNSNISGDIGQFTFLDGGGTNRSFKARVYRRDMNI